MIKDILDIINKEFFANTWNKKDGDMLHELCDVFYENNNSSLLSNSREYTIDIIAEYSYSAIEYKVFELKNLINNELVLIRFEGERTPYGLEYHGYPVIVISDTIEVNTYQPIYINI